MNESVLLSLAAVLGAAFAIIGYIAKGVRLVDEQKKIKEDLARQRLVHDKDMHDIKEEQSVLIYGLLACLKGLNGDMSHVPDAVNKLEKFLNLSAHKS